MGNSLVNKKEELASVAEVIGKMVHINADKTEEILLRAPQAHAPVIHRFGPGIYMREAHYPSGTYVMGHYHKYATMNVFLKGKLMLYLEDGTSQELSAPMIFTSPEGRKTAHILEDVVWINVFATSVTDIETLENMFFKKTDGSVKYMEDRYCENMHLGECARQDFPRMLSDIDMSEEYVRMLSEETRNVIQFPWGSYKVKVYPSTIEGLGLFATAPIIAGEVIGPARIGTMRTPAARYTNHSNTPNAEMITLQNGDSVLVATKFIQGCLGGEVGEEITVDYRQAVAESKGATQCQQV